MVPNKGPQASGSSTPATQSTDAAPKCISERTSYHVQPDLEFLKEFLGDVIEEANVEANLTETLPYGVTVSKRSGKEQKDDVYFLQNFNRHPVKMVLNECYTNLITDEILTGSIKLQTYQCIVMQKK